MNKLNLTVIILTYNEEQHIARCISSVSAIANNVVVIDSFSKDKTTEIAEKLGAKVFQNPWTNHAVQFQWALDHCEITTAWVMRIDADEYVEESLVSALYKFIPALPDNITGVQVKRKYFFLGGWIRHGAMYPHVLRIWRTGVGRIEQRWMDEHVVLLHGESIEIDGSIVDDNLNSATWWIDKHNHYATREMIELLNGRHHFLPRDEHMRRQIGNSTAKRKRVIKEQIYARLPLFVRPILYFLYRYFLRLGFLDGQKGLAYHFMQGLWYRALVDVKVIQAQEWIKHCKSKEEIKAVLAERTGLLL